MMFVVFLLIVLIVKVSSSTFDSSDFGCFPKKNITLYHHRDEEFDHLNEEIQGQLGSTVDILRRSIKRSVSVKTNFNMQEQGIHVLRQPQLPTLG